MTERSPLRWGAVAAGVLVLQALVLAAVAFPAPHNGGDNTAYLALAHSLLEGTGYTELWDPQRPLHTKYPPGYPLVLAFLMALGATTWGAFKTSSAVAMALATVVVYAWASRRVGAVGAGAVALLLILAAGWQDASRWILSEPWFLLWTFVAFWGAEHALGDGGFRPGRDRNGGAPERAAPSPVTMGWLVVGGVGALMAFGVRSAGLPVVLAFGLVLLAARRFRSAAVFGGAAAVVLGSWFFLGRRGVEGAYQDEFWLVNPYDPELGSVGVAGLLGRVWVNVEIYVGRVLPGEWWGGTGASGWALWGLGALMVALAMWGWASRLRRAPGVPEFFAPLYAGMILLWPEVWSGERFLLPLLPLVLVYAGTVLGGVVREFGRVGGWDADRVARVRPVILAVAVTVLAAPATGETLRSMELASSCRVAVARTGDAFVCHGGGFVEFRDAAAWMSVNLPADAVALSRKPRILYALGGPPGRTFPFTRDPDLFLAEADAVGARYLLFDWVDGVAFRFLPEVLSARPGAFCFVAGWGADPPEPGTDLLGILPPELRVEGESDVIPRCPDGWAREPLLQVEPEGVQVPLLVNSAGGRQSSPPSP
ncbi:MAG: hypothetical protein EA422_00710 [Gemmatimonadales bacterium]|nr:MAG: hypothetical protein EA422_00710 [Gemmatimonadales bacterium]